MPASPPGSARPPPDRSDADPPTAEEDPEVSPEDARWDDELGEFVLPYTSVRTAADPDATLLEFLQSTYEAAAECARWDRDLLDRR